jgi:hypothetical protein
MHMQLQSYSATQPNTGAAAAALAGDSLTIQNAKKTVKIIAAWAVSQVAGFVQVAFPSAHDTTRGLRMNTQAVALTHILPIGQVIEVEPQELLAITIAGSNTAGDVEQVCMLQMLDLPGVSGRYIGYGELKRRTEKLTSIQASIAVTAGPAYTGEELITSESDLLKANRDYAIIGATFRTGQAANSNPAVLTIRGPDIGNVRIGIPVSADTLLTSEYFALLSRATGEDCIPVINSGNRAATFIGGACDENGVDIEASLLLALLK